MSYKKTKNEKYSPEYSHLIFLFIKKPIDPDRAYQVDENNFLQPKSSHPGSGIIKYLEWRKKQMNIISRRKVCPEISLNEIIEEKDPKKG
jgi:hypothetical protein